MNYALESAGCCLAAILFCLSPLHAQTPSLDVGMDVVQRAQWLESELGGTANEEEPGFQHSLANVHLRGSLAGDVHAYVELHLNDRGVGADEVQVNEAYLRYTGFDPAAVTVGSFELDFGEQHLYRTDNAQAQDNPFVGNSLVDPAAVQTGIELAGRAGPVDWSLAVTNGLDPNGGSFARSGRSFAYVGKIRADGPVGLSGALSYYTVDQSDLAPPRDNLFTPTATLVNEYQGLLNPAGPTFTKGDVSAYQLDGAWQAAENTLLRAWWGRYEEDAAPFVKDDIAYWSVEARQGFGAAYAAARFGQSENDAIANDDWEKLQVAGGYRLNEATLAKLEYVDQENDVTGDGFDGLVGEMSVRMPAEPGGGPAGLDPSLDVGVDLVQRMQTLESESLGTKQDEDAGFQEPLGNLHLHGTITEDVRAYVELHLNDRGVGADEVEVNEAYLEFVDPAGHSALKLGNFQLDFGSQRRYRSDHAQVQDNPFVGNSLADPSAVQSGVELSGEAGPMEWSLALTNGLDPDAGNTFTPDRGFAYAGRLGRDLPYGLSGALSYYTVDQSDVPATDNLFTPGATLVNEYQGLANPAAPRFARRDVEVYQLDGAWQASDNTLLRAWWGDYEGEGGGTRDEIDYWSVEARQGFGPAYAAARWGELEDDVDPDETWEKKQLSLGYHLREAALAKLEYVDQENDVTGDGFDGLVGELSVSLPAEPVGDTTALDPSLDVGLDLVQRAQALESENNLAAGDEEEGFQNTLANVYLTGDLTDGIGGFVELHLNSQRSFVTDEVHVRQAYLDLRGVAWGVDVKLGQFELDFGHQHKLRSDNAQVKDNLLVGNPIVDAAAVQSGLEFSLKEQAWGGSLAATNGTGEFGLTGATDRFGDGRGWGLVGQLWFSPLSKMTLAASGYAADQSGGPAAENLFSGSSGFLANTYQDLLLSGNATPTMGTGGDVVAFQGDLEYQLLPGTRVLGFWGHMQDDASALHSWNYGSLEVSQTIAPSWYVVGRFSGALDREREDTQEYEKYQLGTGYWVTDNTLAKVEWVDQEQDGGQQAQFDGLVGEVSVSF